MRRLPWASDLGIEDPIQTLSGVFEIDAGASNCAGIFVIGGTVFRVLLQQAEPLLVPHSLRRAASNAITVLLRGSRQSGRSLLLQAGSLKA